MSEQEQGGMQTLAGVAADAARDVMRQHAAAKRQEGPKVVMPGGRVHDARPYLRDAFKAAKFATFMAEVDEHPEKFLKQPTPGAHYGFMGEKDLMAEARISSKNGRYRFIEPTEIREDCNLPYKTNVGPSGKRVQIYDVLMVEISPKAWEEDYKIREAMAVSQLVGNTEAFYAGMEERGANVSEMDVTEDPESTARFFSPKES